MSNEDRALFNWYWDVDEKGIALDFAYRSGSPSRLFEFKKFGKSKMGSDSSKESTPDQSGNEDNTESLADMDEETAFACLISLDGVDKHAEDLAGLRRLIQIRTKQGAPPQKRRDGAHAAIFSDGYEIEKQFAQHYHAFLITADVLPDGKTIMIKDGAKYVKKWPKRPSNGDLCLIMSAHLLNKDEIQQVKEMMNHSGAVFVLAYRTKDEAPPGPIKNRVSLQIRLQEHKPRDTVSVALDAIQTWLKSFTSEMSIEDGIDGPWATTFAKSVVKNLKDDESDDAIRKAVHKQLRLVEHRQGTRLIADVDGDADPCQFNTEDLFGPEPTLGSEKGGPWKELRDMVGLEAVKNQMMDFQAQQISNHYKAMNGERPAEFGLNRLFIGPPGTGKTTVGELYGKILGNMGILKPGGFVFKKASEFIASHIGESAEKTIEILKKAKGKVLMIDEAYMLDPNYNEDRKCPFRDEIINTIVAECQNTAKENRCVILVGYKKNMEKLLKANDGLPRRFPMEDAFVFEQFDEQQLKLVLKETLRRKEARMTDEAFETAMETLLLEKQSPYFGNGGAVAKIVERSQLRYTSRLRDMTTDERKKVSKEGGYLIPDDVNPHRIDLKDLRKPVELLFSDMIGVNGVKEKMCGYADMALSIKANGRPLAQLMPFHFAFKGPKGTGKRTLATQVSWLYNSMRLLATSEVVQTSVRDLSPTGIDSSMKLKPKSFRGVLEEATSKVLIIDNADQLFGSSKEQLREEIAEEIGKPQFQRKVVIILVGLEQPLDRVLESPGFGIFRERLTFKGLTSEECIDRIRVLLRREGVTLALKASERQEIEQMFNCLCRSKEWTNHRDLRLIKDEVTRRAFGKRNVDGGDNSSMSGAEFIQALKDMYPRQVSSAPERARSETRQPTHKSKPSLEVPDHTVRSSRSHDDINHHDRKQLPFRRNATPDEPAANDTTSCNRSPPRIEKNIVRNVPSTSNHQALTIGDAALLEPYRYRNLPSDKHIRVLRLEPSSEHNGPIRCRLEEIVLDDDDHEVEAFDALSYCWDSPELTRPIECDGQRFLVTRSCESAIRYLRHQNTESTLWIDAICIDQSNDEEKSVQVGLMGDVYRLANKVFIWLGEDNDPDGGGLADLKALCDAQRDDIDLEIGLDDNKKRFETLNNMMKHKWWTRMWTFQEFVVAKNPVFVKGMMHFPWDDFSGVMMDLITQRHRRADESERDYIMAAKDSVMGHVRQHWPEIASEMEAWVHMVPTWLEVMDVFVCRAAYTWGKDFAPQQRQLFMSHYLLKSRNRSAGNPRDNIYGLYYLFKISGFQMPKPDYRIPIEDVYRGATEALVEQSGSWWILAQLLNKREGTNIDLPSWVPDFSSRAIWHQSVDLRFQNMYNMMLLLEQEEFGVNKKTSIDFEYKKTSSGILTRVVFLWTVKGKTNDCRPHKVLDRVFEEEFEQAKNSILENAIEDFFFTLAEWLDVMAPEEQLPFSRTPSGEPQREESEVVEAIACAYWRASWKFIRSFGKAGLSKADGEELTDEELAAQPDFIPRHFCDFLCEVLKVVRSCMNPDQSHPCEWCATIEPHSGDPRAQECFNNWINTHRFEGYRYVKYWLYTRAIDHSLFQTDAPAGCGGHFGFCRNSPQKKDEVVLFPGITDPVIIRRRGPDTFQVVGVTTGMTGPVLLEDPDHQAKGAFCLGTCERLGSGEHHELREISLV